MKKALLFLVAVFTISAFSNVYAQSASINGLGKSTLTCIDKDGDGFGVGPGCLGPDADDNDAAVHGSADALAKYGSLSAFLSHLGYAPLRIWYLDASAGNDGTCAVNNIALPCATFAHLSASLVPGDMVVYRAGAAYPPITVPISGTSANPIYVIGYPGESVTISNTLSGDGISVVNVAYIVIDGFKITSPGKTAEDGISGGSWYAASGSVFQSHDITIRNVEIWNNFWGIIVNNCPNLLIENSVLHDSFGEHNIYVGSNNHLTSPTTGLVIRRNILYNGNYNGLQINCGAICTGPIVDQNLIYNNGLSGMSILQGFQSGFIRNNLVFGNSRNALLFHNYDGDCYPNVPGALVCPHDQSENLIENNTLYTGTNDPTGAAISQSGVLVDNGSTGKVGDLGHNTFRNNIVWGTSGTNLNGVYPPIAFTDVAANYLATSTLQNNVLWPQDGGTLVIALGPGSSFAYQGYTCAQVASMTTSGACINSDPKLTDVNPLYYSTPTKFNFSPPAGSPAIGAGSPTGAPVADIGGGARPNPPSIGAYEYNQGSSATPPTVSVISPASGASVAGLISVSASASAGVTGVQFKLDTANLGSLVTRPSYTTSWDTTTVANGFHTVAAIGSDAAGNSAMSSISVTVNNLIPAPIISGVAAGGITSSSATITWTTDRNSDSRVAYGLTIAYGSLSAPVATSVVSHSITLSGLTAATSYHFQALSRDANGNLASSGDLTFTTAALTSGGIPLPANTWTMIATHGVPGEAVGWEKLVYSPAMKKAVMLGNYHQTGSEPNTTLLAYDFAANRWDIMDMGGLFHTENMPDAGHSSGMFTYNPNQNTFIYYCCASGSMEPENPWHTWWFDPIGQVGRDKHSARKPGMTLEGGAAFDSAHNLLVYFDGNAGTWTYSPASNTWTQQTPNGTPPPFGLGLPMMTYNAKDHKVYLFGGKLGYGPGVIFYNSLYTYDVPTNTWTLLAPPGNRPAPREKAGFAYDSLNNVFLLYGGHNDSGVVNPPFNDTWVYDPNANSWTQLSPSQSPPATDTSFERLAYDPDHNAFIMVLEGPSGYADGVWPGYYPMQTWLFRYQGPGADAGTSPVSFQPSPGSINRNSDGWAQEPSLAVLGSTLYSTWVETGKPFDLTDGAWSHVYVNQLTGGNWNQIGGAFNSVNSELTVVSGHSESHSPSISAIDGTPWVSYYQATPDNTHPFPDAIYAKSWNGSTWTGGPIGLVNNAPAVYQSRSQIASVDGLAHIAFLEVDKTIWPQEAFGYVKQWNGTQWSLKGTGPLNRNVGTLTLTPLSIADSISITSDGTNPEVAWTEYTTDAGSVQQTPPQVYVSRWDGSQWVAVGGSLNVNPSNWAYDASIAFLSGQPYVAWTERTIGGNAQIFVKTFNGTNWILVGSGTLNRDINTGWAFRPSLIADSVSGALYVGWVEQQAIGQRAQTYVSRFSNGSWNPIGGSLNTNVLLGSAQRVSLAILGAQPVAAWGEVNPGSMRQIFVKQWNGSSWTVPTGSQPQLSCDQNLDGMVNLLDVQLATNQALGVVPCRSGDLQQNGVCSGIDVQRIITASLGGACIIGN